MPETEQNLIKELVSTPLNVPAFLNKWRNTSIDENFIKRATPHINSAYNNNPKTRNLYSCLALLFAQACLPEPAFALWHKDKTANRITWKQELSWARERFLFGEQDKAIEQIETVYHENPEANCGFSMIAKAIVAGSPEKATELYLRDFENNRINTDAAQALALLLSKKGDLERACSVAEFVYRTSDSPTDLFTRIGESFFGPQKDYESIELYIKKDKLADRAASYTACIKARNVAMQGEIKESVRILKDTYSSYKSSTNLFESISIHLMYAWRFHDALDILAHEIRPSRQHSRLVHHCKMAIAELDASIQFFGDDHIAVLKKELQSIEAAPVEQTSFSVLQSEIYSRSRYDCAHLYREVVILQPYHFTTQTQTPRIIDAGSNCGFSIAYFKHLFPNSEIEAFEPNPFLAESIRKSIAKNRWENVTFHEAALSSVASQELVLQIPRGNAMGSSIMDDFVRSTSAVEKVKVTTMELKPYLDREVHFLKLDIEGVEAEVLLSIGPAIKNVRQGFIEYHYRPDMPDQNRLSAIVDCLESNNFSYRIEEPFKRFPPSLHLPRQGTRKPWSCSIYFSNLMIRQ